MHYTNRNPLVRVTLAVFATLSCTHTVVVCDLPVEYAIDTARQSDMRAMLYCIVSSCCVVCNVSLQYVDNWYGFIVCDRYSACAQHVRVWTSASSVATYLYLWLYAWDVRITRPLNMSRTYRCSAFGHVVHSRTVTVLNHKQRIAYECPASATICEWKFVQIFGKRG